MIKLIQPRQSGNITYYTRDLLPHEWKSSKSIKDVEVTGFQILVQPDFFPQVGFRRVVIGDLSAVFIYGKVSFVRDIEHFFVENSRSSISGKLLGGGDAIELPVSPLVLFIQGAGDDGVKDVDRYGHTPHIGVEVGSGLIGACFGKNAVYRPLFTNVVNIRSNKVTISGAKWRFLKGGLKKDSFSDEQFRDLEELSDAIIENKISNLDRVKEALQWFYLAQQTDANDEPNAFLKYWIALEVLVMPNTRNIRPIRDHLAAAYCIEKGRAKEQFYIGELFGLRSRIVHDGEYGLRISEALRLIEAVFVDTLREYMDLSCERRAKRLLRHPKFKTNKLLETFKK